MWSVAVAVLALVCGFANAAYAETRTIVRTETYAVAGKSGEALMKAMNLKGPNHGFLVRAMAQTRYSVKWNMDWAKTADACKLRRADAVLSVTYRYPKISGTVSPDLKRRWGAFMAGVRAHEETHGQIAQQMVAAAHKAISGIANSNDQNCAKSQSEVRRRVNMVYAEYERRQRKFDAKEHHYGGNVDGLVALLTD
jgi:predicted secreted Zn-dependent protease